MDAAAASAAFSRLTELADLLLNAGGELGIYADRKEALERFARAVLPQRDVLAAAAAAAGGDDDDDDDMFADGDDAGGAAASAKAPQQQPLPQQQAPQPQQQQPPQQQQAPQQPAAPAAAAQPAAPAQQPQVDYGSWPVKELRRFLTERGVDSSSLVEKAELVAEVSGARVCVCVGGDRGAGCMRRGAHARGSARAATRCRVSAVCMHTHAQVERAAARGPATTGRAAAAASASAPDGYNFDRASGLFHSPETGLYWDASSGAFWNSTEQKWYAWDGAAGAYKEWTAPQS
jgi:chemotaxis protein histidine kinase CheA